MKGAEEGDDIGDADDDRHQQCAGELEDDAGEVAEHTNDGGVHDLAVDEAAEHLVCVEDFLLDELRPVGLDDAVEDHLGLLGELFAAGQQVNSDDKPMSRFLNQVTTLMTPTPHTAQDALYILQRGEQGGAQSGQVVSNGIVGIVEIRPSVSHYPRRHSCVFTHRMNRVMLVCAV